MTSDSVYADPDGIEALSSPYAASAAQFAALSPAFADISATLLWGLADDETAAQIKPIVAGAMTAVYANVDTRRQKLEAYGNQFTTTSKNFREAGAEVDHHAHGYAKAVRELPVSGGSTASPVGGTTGAVAHPESTTGSSPGVPLERRRATDVVPNADGFTPVHVEPRHQTEPNEGRFAPTPPLGAPGERVAASVENESQDGGQPYVLLPAPDPLTLAERDELNTPLIAYTKQPNQP